MREGKPLPWEYWRWRIVKATGWTLEYVDHLSLADFYEYWQVEDAIAKWRNPR